MFWCIDSELEFFNMALNNFSTPQQLFYKLKDGYFAYIPKGSDSENLTLQSRNSLIGHYTEKWCKDFFNPVAKNLGLYATNSVICEELGLISSSSADLAFCTTDSVTQSANNIKIIFEIKMSL